MDVKNSNEIVLYAVRNKEGQWFRKIGYGGSGKSWTDKFALARIYTKIGPARGVVSWWANNFPNHPTPDLIKLEVSNIIVLDESDRIKDQKDKKERAEAAKEVRNKQYLLKQAEKELEEAKAKIAKLKNG